MPDAEKRFAFFYDGNRQMGWNETDGPYWHGTGSSVEERLYEAIEGMAELHARLGTDETRIAELEAEVARLTNVLADLMSWFPAKPGKPEWRIEAGKYGADDAIEAARHALTTGEPAPEAQQAGVTEAGAWQTAAARDVLTERERQQTIEDFDDLHDDMATRGQLAAAALGYVQSALSRPHSPLRGLPAFWPWEAEWWKPTTPRRDLVKAGALILAEIERLDRAAPSGSETQGGESDD